jgi:hypothetical protein
LALVAPHAVYIIAIRPIQGRMAANDQLEQAGISAGRRRQRSCVRPQAWPCIGHAKARGVIGTVDYRQYYPGNRRELGGLLDCVVGTH